MLQNLVSCSCLPLFSDSRQETAMSLSPTVFISYNLGSDEYMDLVKSLFDRLRADGINCIDDRACPPGTHWRSWVPQQIDSADFVLLIAPHHKLPFFSATIIEEKLYENPRSTKIIPIVFETQDIFNLPRIFLDYQLAQFPRDYESLYRLLSGQREQKTAITNEFRIDRLEIRNFKKFSAYTCDFCPQFTLLVGNNGTGKTTMLDALAVAAGVWLIDYPEATLANSGRNILSHEIRAETIETSDSFRLTDCKPVEVSATGVIGTETVSWQRKISLKGSRTSNSDSKKAMQIIAQLFEQDRTGEKAWLPIIAYYGAGRAWLPSNSRDRKTKLANEPSRRWDAFYDCLAERIRINDLQNWFHREAIAALNNHGEMRMAYKVVKFAILHCIPEAVNLWFDPDRLEIMLLIDGQALPFNSLSAGQKMMVALVADIAIKMVTQNFAFLAEESALDYQTLPQVLQKTPGLVLIDELDVHLHPKWQRRVVNDLKNTFPSIQFVCTSHSPFIIQSISPGELRSLDVEDSQPLQYANQSIEDIQLVDMPQQSLKAQQLAQATERYFTLLQNQDAADSDELVTAEANYRQALQPFSDDPGLTAILKLEAMAKAQEQEAE
jgi:predicted ATP-binding protein involved in virulence